MIPPLGAVLLHNAFVTQKDLLWIAPALLLLSIWLASLISYLILKPFHVAARITRFVTLGGVALALYTAYTHYCQLHPGTAVQLFNGLLQLDHIALQAHMLLLGSTFLIAISFPVPHSTDPWQATSSLANLVAPLLGAYCLAVANHWMVVYLSVVWIGLSTVPLILASQAASVARQYLLYSIVASTLMVWGLSYQYGLTGDLQLAKTVLPDPAAVRAGLFYYAMLGFYLPLVGLLMVLGSFPFQFWVTATYPAIACREAAYLSTIPKIAVIFFLVRLQQVVSDNLTTASQDSLNGWQILWAIVALCSLVLGHLAALQAHQAKRLLAAGTVAQTGFVCAALVAKASCAPISYYMVIYSMMNIAAWIGLEALATGADRFGIKDYAGVGRRRLLEAFCFSLVAFSLVGLPPMAGFIAKINIILPLWPVATANPLLMLLIATMGIGTIISLYYYLKIPYSLFFSEAALPVPAATPGWLTYGLVLLTTLLIIFFHESLLTCL
jgi:NADH-quinone oxidoreductase subunit N